MKVNKAVIPAAGIDDVLLVSSQQKPAIEKHFASDPDLSDRLKKSGKSHLLASIDSLIENLRAAA